MPTRIPVSQPYLSKNCRKYVIDALDTNWVSAGGPYNEAFERAFADFVGARHAVTVSNGTVALHLLVAALGIGPGDEVIVPTLTYIATANAVRYTGATVRFVDSDPITWGLEPGEVEKAITDKTRAVIAVHLYGKAAEVEQLRSICERESIYLLEDAAEAVGTMVGSQHVGTFGVAGTFSFFGNKTVTTGEGGMIVTDDADLRDRMVLLRGQGMSAVRRYWFEEIGFNYRMTNVQAALGLGQIEDVGDHIKARRSIASAYSENLVELSHQGAVLPTEEVGTTNSFWLYTLLLPPKAAPARERIQFELQELGIETRNIFYPLHTLPPYASEQKFLTAEDLSQRGLSLPTFRGLDERDIVFISRKLGDLVSQYIN